jgi:hypothetical protein
MGRRTSKNKGAQNTAPGHCGGTTRRGFGVNKTQYKELSKHLDASKPRHGGGCGDGSTADTSCPVHDEAEHSVFYDAPENFVEDLDAAYWRHEEYDTGASIRYHVNTNTPTLNPTLSDIMCRYYGVVLNCIVSQCISGVCWRAIA